jgi:serine/threonine protein kinase
MEVSSEKQAKKIKSFLPLNKLIFKKFTIEKVISEGIFGEIYLVKNEKDNKYYTMKAEKNDSNIKILEQEGYNLFILKGLGIPQLVSYGKIKNYDILIQELLGKSLNELFIENNFQFSMNDICLISIQLIDRVEWVHSKTLIHRDIKPENFLLGSNNPNIIYLTGFGLCTKYCSSKSGKHIMPGFRGTFSGTIKYSSANAQRGNQLSRRDDLESLGYTILYFMKGGLPWMNLNQNINEKEAYIKTYSMKKFMPVERLCKGAPSEMQDYFRYIRQLKFKEDPNYDYLRNLFVNLLKKNGIENYQNYCFSWVHDWNANFSVRRKKSAKIRLYSKLLNRINSRRARANEIDLSKENDKVSRNKTFNEIQINNNNKYIEFSPVLNNKINDQIINPIGKIGIKEELTDRNLETEIDDNNLNYLKDDIKNHYYKINNGALNKKRFLNNKTFDLNRKNNNNYINKDNRKLQMKINNPNVNITNINIYNNRIQTGNNSDINYQILNTISNSKDINKNKYINPLKLNNNIMSNNNNSNYYKDSNQLIIKKPNMVINNNNAYHKNFFSYKQAATRLTETGKNQISFNDNIKVGKAEKKSMDINNNYNISNNFYYNSVIKK